MGQSTLAAARAKARRRNREHLKRSAYSDITPGQEAEMRRKARKCPLCCTYMTIRPGHPNSKHLDHIIPVNIGGTHTHGNVRIICRTCNLKRPKDGSDYTGPVTLWAQGEIPVKRPRKKKIGNTVTCRRGLHPWVTANIKVTPNGKKRCRACDEARAPLRPCARCGLPSSLPGSQAMCPPCLDSTAREAARLHASGLPWDQVAPLVGYGSGWGAAYAAKRAGYVPAARPVAAPQGPTCPECGKTRAKRARWCGECTQEKAAGAARMHEQGLNLRAIADILGYSSITTVSNLIKSTATVDMRIGRPMIMSR